MYQLKNNGTNAQLLVYDEIGYEGTTALKAVQELTKAKPEYLEIRINSQGGDVFEAIAIYNYIKGMNIPVAVFIDGLAASAASVIAMSGVIVMPENAMMMIHNPWGVCQGTSEDMQKSIDVLEKVKESIANIYMSKTGLSQEEIYEMMRAETWMNGREAVSKGFADEIGGVVKDSARDAFEAGVKAERERLKALDELMSPDREEIIMKAKYETFMNAKDIAVDLLKAHDTMKTRLENRRFDAGDVDGISMKMPVQDKIADGVKMLNRMRGYE